MIAKSKRGRAFGPLLRYVAASTDHAGRLRDRATLLFATLPGATARELTASFNALRRLRPGLGVCCQHTILSFRPDAPTPDDATARTVASAWAEAMGFQDYAVHRHDARHLHLTLSRIRRDGTVVPDRNDFARSERIVRRLEAEHGLAPDRGSRHTDPDAVKPERRCPAPGEVASAARVGQAPTRARLQRLVTAALGRGVTLPRFCQSLETFGVEVRLNLANTGAITGISFRLEDFACKGSELGKAFTWASLQKRGLDYEQQRDAEDAAARRQAQPRPAGGPARATDPAGDRAGQAGADLRPADGRTAGASAIDAGGGLGPARAAGGPAGPAGGYPVPGPTQEHRGPGDRAGCAGPDADPDGAAGRGDAGAVPAGATPGGRGSGADGDRPHSEHGSARGAAGLGGDAARDRGPERAGAGADRGPARARPKLESRARASHEAAAPGDRAGGGRRDEHGNGGGAGAGRSARGDGLYGRGVLGRYPVRGARPDTAPRGQDPEHRPQRGPADDGAGFRRAGRRRGRPVVGGTPVLTTALVEAVDAFRRAWSRARGTRPARDLAAVAAVLRRGLTGAQALRVWREAQPDAQEPAPGYMRAILRQARDFLRRNPDRPSRSSAPPGP